MPADVRLRLRGLMTEKFIGRALQDGVALHNVRRAGPREVRFEATEQDAKTLMRLAETYKQDLTVLGAFGMSRVKAMILDRPSLPVAVALALALAWLFLSRLWLIQLPPDAPDILAPTLKSLGVRPGVPLSSINTRRLEDSLYVALGDYAFIGARLDGVRLKITAVHELPRPELYDPDAARDLVAKDDAIILNIDALAGVAAVKPGDTVKKGQLLIRGQEKVTGDAVRGVCALGSAVGRSWITAYAEGSANYQELLPTGNLSLESELRLFDYTVPLVRGHSYASERAEVQILPVGGLFLPLQIRRTAHIETAPVQKSIEIAALKAELSATSMENALANVPSGAEIVDKWTDYSMIEGDVIRARAVVEVRQNIAVSRSALAMEGN